MQSQFEKWDLAPEAKALSLIGWLVLCCILFTMARPRQVAYLRFMGFDEADKLSEEQAENLIERIRQPSTFPSKAAFEKAVRKMEEWKVQRFYDFPHLFENDRRTEIEFMEPTLRSYVRNQVPDASEKLTREKFNDVLAHLEKSDYFWWLKEGSGARFFEALGKVHPRCVEGRALSEKEKHTQEMPLHSDPDPIPVNPIQPEPQRYTLPSERTSVRSRTKRVMIGLWVLLGSAGLYLLFKLLALLVGSAR